MGVTEIGRKSDNVEGLGILGTGDMTATVGNGSHLALISSNFRLSVAVAIT